MLVSSTALLVYTSSVSLYLAECACLLQARTYTLNTSPFLPSQGREREGSFL